MTAADDFSLRGLIKDVIDEGVVDPTDIAAKVIAQLPKAHLKDALEESLRHYVVVIVSNVRASMQDGSGPRRTRAGLVRDWYESWLAQPMHAGDKWLALGECTSADLQIAVSERRAHAAQTNAIADQLQNLADELRKSKATYVNQLPRDLVARLTGRAS